MSAAALSLRVALYYGALAAAAWLLERSFPGRWAALLRILPAAAAVATLGAVVLMLPVAWVYMRTKPRARYDASLVHTVIILPLVIAGVVLIVRDSLALAFSLAGIVAAVRFRNTLRDTKDAVYIFLAIAIGLAAGVQAFAVAWVVSLVYVFVVLVLWGFDVGADTRSARVRGRLVVETARADAAAALAAALDRHARRWKPLKEASRAGELGFAVELRRGTTPDELAAAIRRDAGADVGSLRFEAARD